ncbi:hypothetical protein ACFL96_15955 [Thermoproteota archaeon]
MIYIVLCLAVAPLSFAQEDISDQSDVFSDPAEYMSRIDSSHTKDEFASMLDLILTYYPSLKMTREDEGFLLFTAWTQVTEAGARIALYDFIEDFERFILVNDYSLTFDELLSEYAVSIISIRVEKRLPPSPLRRKKNK